MELYKIGKEKGFDVSERIAEIERIRIAEIERIIEEEEAKQRRNYHEDYYDYDDDYHDYGRDTWDALTDGMYGDYPGPGVDYDFLGF